MKKSPLKTGDSFITVEILVIEKCPNRSHFKFV